MATSGEGNPLKQQIAAAAVKKFQEKEGDIKGAITSIEKTKEDAPPKPASTFMGKNNFVATSRDPRRPPPGFYPQPPRQRKQADAAWMNNAAPSPPSEPKLFLQRPIAIR